MVTSSLAVDYVGTALVGDWVESAVTVVKAGGRLAFVNALITAREAGAARPVASARAVFLVLPPPAAA
jgi:acyl-coenzyme A thioesterase PaaI-like protein